MNKFVLFNSIVDSAFRQARPYAGAVLITFFRYANQDNVTFATPNRVGATLGIKAAHIYPRINKLYDLGWLRVAEKGGGRSHITHREICGPDSLRARAEAANPRPHFWETFNAIVDRAYLELDPVSVMVLLGHLRHARADDISEVHPKVLATSFRIGERKVRKIIRSLDESGWLVKRCPIGQVHRDKATGTPALKSYGAGGRGNVARREIVIPPIPETESPPVVIAA